MNKPGYARRKERECSANPVLWKQALRLLLLCHVRTATDLSCPNRPYQPHSDTSPTCDRPVMLWSSSPSDGHNNNSLFHSLGNHRD